jgi:recombinational DNA repair protein (RecF pathway)
LLEENTNNQPAFIDAVLEALARLGVSPECHDCGAQETWDDGWHVSQSPAAFFCKDRSHVEVAVLGCSTCGSVRTFLLQVLGVAVAEPEQCRVIVAPGPMSRREH